MSNPDPRWVRVGRFIEQRIAEMSASKAEIQRRAGISDKTLTGYMAGRPVKRVDKARALCDALGWSRRSIALILDGGEPELASAATLTGEDLARLEDKLMQMEDDLLAMKRRALSDAADLSEIRRHLTGLPVEDGEQPVGVEQRVSGLEEALQTIRSLVEHIAREVDAPGP